MPSQEPTLSSLPLGSAALGQHVRTRHWIDRFMTGVVAACAALGVAIMVIIVGYVIWKGWGALDVPFFTQRPLPYGEVGGGVAPAILGSLMLLGVAGLLGIPMGIGIAIYLAEFGRGTFAAAVRFVVDLMAGVPSIVVGVLVWALFVRRVVGQYNGLAGSVALAIIMVPIVARTVEEVLRLVPDTLREAALALGIPRWKTILWVVLPTAKAGVLTGVILSLARAGGETAPLLLTTLGNQFFSFDPLKPMAALPIQIYNYAVSPYDDWHTKAWGAALILIIVIGALSLATRWATRSPMVQK